MLIARILREPPDNLSEAEIAFWRRLTWGESPRDIGKGLGLGQVAALGVQRSLLQKLGVSRIVEAVREGIYAGL
jgi:hypothetical protein